VLADAEAETEAEESEDEVNGVEENIPNLDFLGTNRFLPPVVSGAFSSPFPTFDTFGASPREGFDAAAASHESSKARANDAELVLVLVSEEEEITVDPGVAEINRIEGMAPGADAMAVAGWEMGAVACIALGVGRDEWGGCAEVEWVGWFIVVDDNDETKGMLITVVVVVRNCNCCCG
jgi:hypothetical protein